MRGVGRLDACSPSVALAAFCVALAILPDRVAQALQWNRDALAAGELWRLWTGHCVHYSLRHALLDGAGFAILGWMAEADFGKRRVAAALLLGAPALSLGLLAVPAIEAYRGASGLDMLLATLAGFAAWRRSSERRAALVVIAIALLAKIVADAAGPQVTLAGLPSAVRVAWQVHVLGIAFGAAMIACAPATLRARFDSGQLAQTSDVPATVSAAE